jgi:hypothetical protein
MAIVVKLRQVVVRAVKVFAASLRKTPRGKIIIHYKIRTQLLRITSLYIFNLVQS